MNHSQTTLRWAESQVKKPLFGELWASNSCDQGFGSVCTHADPIRATLIFNTLSGQLQESPQQLADIIMAMQGHGIAPEVYMIRQDSPVESVVRNAIKVGVKLIVVAGGILTGLPASVVSLAIADLVREGEIPLLAGALAPGDHGQAVNHAGDRFQERGLLHVHRNGNQVRIFNRRDGKFRERTRECRWRCAQVKAPGAARTGCWLLGCSLFGAEIQCP